MAQFIIGFAAGIYIGTHYNCKPGLKLASDTLEQYCPKREPNEDYVPINGLDDKAELAATDKVKKDIELVKKSKWF